MESKRQQSQQRRRGRFTPEQMTFWGTVLPPVYTLFIDESNLPAILGYKFETLCTLSRPWGEISRTEIESRPNDVVSNKAQYCSVAITNLGPTKMCLAGEIDARESSPVPFSTPPTIYSTSLEHI